MKNAHMSNYWRGRRDARRNGGAARVVDQVKSGAYRHGYEQYTRVNGGRANG